MKSEIIHGDCLEVLKKMSSGSVDVVITDPPFFAPAVHYQSRIEWGRKWSDMSIMTTWWDVVSMELARITKKTGHVLVFCNADSYPAFFQAMYKYWSKLVCLVWDKDRPGLGRVWRHQHELIIAARNRDYYVIDSKVRPDVLRYKATLSKDREHPVEKPIELLRELMRPIVPGGGIVLDPFAGSGSTCLAAYLEGFDSIGIEMEKEYIEIIKSRFNRWTNWDPLKKYDTTERKEQTTFTFQ